MAKKLFLALTVFLSLSFFIFYYWRGYNGPAVGIDDANIYFVYMRNFAQGHGFVWNVGEERVEGFTSLLWTLIGSGFYAMSPTHFPTLLLILGASCAFLVLYQVLSFSRKINGTEEKWFTATDLILLSLLLLPRGFIEWNVLCLMETSLWGLLLVTITLQLAKYYFNGNRVGIIPFSILIILINLTRPESLLFNFIFVGLLARMLQADYGWKSALKKISLPLITHLVSFGALVSWRLSYFGYPFPNTYYAKVSGSKKDNIAGGLKYLFNFLNFYPQTAAVTVVFAFLAWFIFRKWQSKTSFTTEEKMLCVLLTVIFSGLALPIITGGDHFMFSRFYQPLLPLVFVTITFGYIWKVILGLRPQGQLAKTAITASIIALCLFQSKSNIFDFTKNMYKSFGEFMLAQAGREAGDQLNDFFSGLPSYPTLGTMATGGIGYKYKGKTIDLLGLNSTVMAHANTIKTGVRNHASFDKGAFWKLRPDILGTAWGGEIIKDPSTFVLYENQEYYRQSDFIYESYKKIFDDKDFRAAYIPALVKEKKHRFYVFGYYAKPFLQSLNTSEFEIKVLERSFNPDKLTTQ